MINVIVTYTVKQDRVAENEKLVRAVYEELHEIGNPDVHYATFKKEDGRTFVHIAFFPDKEAQAVLGTQRRSRRSKRTSKIAVRPRQTHSPCHR